MTTQLRQLWAREPVRAAAWLLLILAVAFLPCVLGTRTFMASARDAASIVPDGAWAGAHKTPPFPKTLDEGVPGYMTEPWFRLIGHQYWTEGNAPLWNPYQAFGMPLAANMESQPFYPLTALLSLHLTPWTYNLYILARLYIAGLFLYFFLRLFISHVPALAGGIACMLGGYYVLFLTMQQTSVEVLAPAALYTGELLLRKQSYRHYALFSVVTGVVLLGGMPESSFILLLFVYAYLIFRLVSAPELRTGWLRRTLFAGAATTTGFLLAAILLLPFAEFLRLSFDLHQPANLGGLIGGLVHDAWSTSIVTYLLPLQNGPPNNTLFVGLRNYIGIIPFYLTLLAISASFGRKTSHDQLRAITLFFSAAALVAILKRYGFPGLNTIGALPMFRLITFPKYDELVVTVSASVLAALGLERLVKKEVSDFGKAILFWGLVVLVIIARSVPSAIGSLNNFGRVPFPIRTWPTATALCLLVGLAVILAIRDRRDALPASTALRLTRLLAVEAVLAYIVPVYYVYNKLPHTASNPYLGAPYLSALQQGDKNNVRLFLRDGVLFPDWASAFRLPDVRAVGAMYYSKYFDFLHAFFPPAPESSGGELSNRFNGAGAYEFADPLSLRFLQLTSTQIVGGIRAYTKPNARVREILTQSAGHLAPGKEANISLKQFLLDGDAQDGLGEHPPYQRLPYTVKVPGSGSADFRFAIALDPAVFNIDAGDGVGFTLELRDASSVIHPLFSHYLDPHHRSQDRHWFHSSVDLSAYRGQVVQLLFSTDPGPKGDLAYDWATWSDLHLPGDPEPGLMQPFQPFYNGEVNLYRYYQTVPRAAIYSHVDLAPSPAAALARLTAPGFDPLQSAVVDTGSLAGASRDALQALQAAPSQPVRSAVIDRYQSRGVAIKAQLDQPGLLVLNDSDYPGWRATVDGNPVPSFTVNYMFRGVLLPPGNHNVGFQYNPPSYVWGRTISAATLTILLAAGLFSRFGRGPRLA